ncbi:hypothetical protein BSKO_10589 [Bryopsis sp. KO-2023]|nr:hypothetical protein BSKO_10589 [Bryopsis sp. KO-2023]
MHQRSCTLPSAHLCVPSRPAFASKPGRVRRIANDTHPTHARVSSTGFVGGSASGAGTRRLSAMDVSWKCRAAICTSVTAETVPEALREIEEAERSGADIVELRLDFIKDIKDKPVETVAALMRKCTKPYIVTFRPVWEGGNYDGDEKLRIAALKTACVAGAPMVDIELKAAKAFFDAEYDVPSTCKVIISSHDFEKTPSQEELDVLVSKIWKAGAQIAKVAAMAKDITDTHKMINLLRNKQGPTIALSMGESGQIMRILAPKYGGFLTFGALGEGRESAPGQPTVRQLRTLYRLPKMTSKTKVFGVIGDPVSKSRGPLLHNKSMEAVGFDGVYVPLLVKDFNSFFDTFDGGEISGCSVTMPHKGAALAYASEVDELTEKIGACNTLVRDDDDGKILKGYNTDVEAVTAIEAALGPEDSLSGKTFVVIGAGGAAQAIGFAANSRGAKVLIANRTKSKAESLASSISDTAEAVDWEDLQAGKIAGDVLANTTSLGMQPDVDTTPVPKAVLGNFSLVFDAVYVPLNTRLLREADESGCKTVNGVEMFVSQAAEQFKLFTKQEGPVDLMRKVVLDDLTS